MAGDRKILDKAAIQVNHSSDVQFNVVTDPQININARLGGHCPACNRFNPAGYFKCGSCERDYFCPEHFDRPRRLCPSCSAAAARQEILDAEAANRRLKEEKVEEDMMGVMAGVGIAAGSTVSIIFWAKDALSFLPPLVGGLLLFAIPALAGFGGSMVGTSNPWVIRRSLYGLRNGILASLPSSIISLFYVTAHESRSLGTFIIPLIITLPFGLLGFYVGWKKGGLYR